MNKEIKDFFVRNGAKDIIRIDDCSINLLSKEIYILKAYEIAISIEKDIPLDRIKALIYGLTGKNLD